ncbi:MAG: tRNA pseudouridine(55) synthase TruB [Chitinophagales bacterium]|nr:tRNA pseudouridine(55) synthase TruB [Chitinophagales bacterium]
MLDFENGAMLLINKPYEWTSFDVVKKVRYTIEKKLGKKLKVGHAGTLDPLATGLLILCTGKATKDITGFIELDKEYTGTFYVGATTPSFDRETEDDQTFPVQHITSELLHSTAKIFLGQTKQIPPSYSAVKVGGKPVYRKAHKGNLVELEPRTVTISEFELSEIALPLVKFRVRCSKGTYIRSLAHDFGKALESGAYLNSLCRTRIGSFSLENAKELPELLIQINEG